MKITMFHGASCPHCKHMMPIVEKLEEEGFEFERLEVWENKENAKKMRGFKEIIMPVCGDGLGVPAFVDIENKRAICGEKTPEELKEWIGK